MRGRIDVRALPALAVAAVLTLWLLAPIAPMEARSAPGMDAVLASDPVPEACTPEAAEARTPLRVPSPELLADRRGELLDSIGTGVAVIRSADPLALVGDYPQASDFRQNNDYLYFTGLETPNSWLLLVARGDGARAEILFIPERDPMEERWTGPQPGPEEAAAISGVEDVRETTEFKELAAEGQLSRLGAPIHVPMNRRTMDDPVIRDIVSEAGAVQVRDVEPEVAPLRLVKDEFELEMLRETIRITEAGICRALQAVRPGMYEYELEAVVEGTFRGAGAERVGFPSIVGSGPNSVVLHYDRNRRQMEAGDLVVMDVGAEYSYYTADISRTFPVSGEFTDRQREIYELVLSSQQAGIDAVRPGATMADVDRAARGHMREHSGDLCGEENCTRYFIHGTSHWLGMDVHDVGDYGTPFQPGMVLTVEPGIYIPEEELGVRIEDDVLVTEDGAEVLSDGIPRDPDELEALMREGQQGRR